jgi:predicted transposase YbfD/YdcC
MDKKEHTTFIAVLQQVPDPRKARGKRHAWQVLVTLISAALAAGCHTPHAIAQWVGLHAKALQPLLCPQAKRLPSEATVVRVLRHIDLAALEQQFSQSVACSSEPPQRWGTQLSGVAIDGKRVCGASTHGLKLHLVSLVQHHGATTLAQVAVAEKKSELAAIPELVDGRDLSGCVVTLDAFFTHRSVAQCIRTQNGHYLMMVKQNQRRLAADIEQFFALPAIAADKEQWERVQTVSKGHGRLEQRVLECGTGVWQEWNWPDVAQIIRRTCTRVKLTSGEVTTAISYGLTDLPPSKAGAAELEALWRGHWTIENRSHHVRDVTLGEDAGQAYTGNTAHALAAWRNGILLLLRRAGWTNIADALRAYAASLPDALSLVGFKPSRL